MKKKKMFSFTRDSDNVPNTNETKKISQIHVRNQFNGTPRWVLTLSKNF